MSKSNSSLPAGSRLVKREVRVRVLAMEIFWESVNFRICNMINLINLMNLINPQTEKHSGNPQTGRYLRLIAIILALFTGVGLYAQDWSLVWSDEFEYTGLPDPTKWGYDVGGNGWGNQELQYYTDKRSENARIEDGKLIIEAIREKYSGKDYTSARLITKNHGDWLYGKVVVSAKLPKGRGTWPAIWMLPTDWEYGGWPSSGEIDIMEHVGYDEGNVHATVHTEAYNHMLGTQQGNVIKLNDATSAFHEYSMVWTPDQIDFFADSVKYFTFYRYGTDYKKWPFNKRFHLLLNIAVGGSWGGVQGVDVYAFPVKLEIQYVRVYQMSTGIEGEGMNEFSNPDGTDPDFSIFPNPFTGQVRIHYPGNIDQVEIYNSQGTRIMDINDLFSIYSGGIPAGAEYSSCILNLEGLNPGLYFLALRNNDEIVGLRKAIKF